MVHQEYHLLQRHQKNRQKNLYCMVKGIHSYFLYLLHHQLLLWN